MTTATTPAAAVQPARAPASIRPNRDRRRVRRRLYGLLAVVLPAIAAAVALGASALAQRLRPVRVSTAVFE